MNKIKSFRKNKKISQKVLAEKLRVKQNTISDWEREYRMPSLKKAIELAEILEVTVEEIFK